MRNVDSIVVCAGMDEEIFYSKTTAFQVEPDFTNFKFSLKLKQLIFDYFYLA